MLDHDDGVAGIDQTPQLLDQSHDIGGMETRGRLVENGERVAVLNPLQLGRELDPLEMSAVSTPRISGTIVRLFRFP